MCVVIEVALIVEMYEVMVVVIMVSWCHASSLGVFGKVVRLALVVVSLSGVLMITEGVVAVLEEDSAQRAVKVSSHVVFPGQLLQGSSTLFIVCVDNTTENNSEVQQKVVNLRHHVHVHHIVHLTLYISPAGVFPPTA